MAKIVAGDLILDATEEVKSSSGTAAAPGLTFNADAGNNTGFFLKAENDIGVAVNGAETGDFSTTAFTSTLPIIIPVGLVGTPSLTFAGDTNTGIYHSGADVLDITTGGIQRLRTTGGAADTTLTIDAPTANTYLMFSRAGVNKGEIYYDNTSFGFTHASLRVGMYVSDDGAGTVNAGLQMDGDGYWSVDLTSKNFVFETINQMQTPSGSAATPMYSTYNDTNTGMYFGGADDLYLATGGAYRFRITGGACYLGPSGADYSMPVTRGVLGQVLTSNGAGVASWADPGGVQVAVNAAASATTTIDSFAITSGTGCIWHYTVDNGPNTNMRAGTITAIWTSTGASIRQDEKSTTDIGDSSTLTWTVDYSAPNIRLRAVNALAGIYACRLRRITI